MKTTTTDPTRSAVMRAVKSKNTKPELIVRRIILGLGFRYRLYRKDLPGNPDIVFPGRRKIVMVHGCFWHGHNCVRGARQPKANADYWHAKIARNVERDALSNTALREAGWDLLTIWECETKSRDLPALASRLESFLSTKPPRKRVTRRTPS